MTISKTLTMRSAEIAAVDRLNEFCTCLWTGTLTAGNYITVPDMDKYHLFAVETVEGNTPLFVFVPTGDTHFNGGVGYITATPRGFVYGMKATIGTNNKLTLDYAGYIRLDNAAINPLTISAIWGII